MAVITECWCYHQNMIFSNHFSNLNCQIADFRIVLLVLWSFNWAACCLLLEIISEQLCDYISSLSPVLLSLLVFTGKPPAVDGVVGAVPRGGGHVQDHLHARPGVRHAGEVQGGEIWVRIRAVKQFDHSVVFPHFLPARPQGGVGGAEVTWTHSRLQVQAVRRPGGGAADLGKFWSC